MSTRGIIISGKSFLTEKQTNLDLSGGIDDISLRRYLTYWDEIHYVDPSYFGGLNLENPDYKLLSEEGILKSEVIKFPGTFDFSLRTLQSREQAQLIYHKRINQIEKTKKYSIAQSGNILNLPTDTKKTTNCLELELGNCLPIPINCSIEDILKLKEQRRPELLAFRDAINALANNIDNEDYSKDTLVRASEKIERSMLIIHRVMDESRIEKTLTSMKSYLNVTDSSALNVLFPLLGVISASEINIPPSLGGAIGLGVNAALNFAIKRQSKIESLESSTQDYAYLYYVENLKK